MESILAFLSGQMNRPGLYGSLEVSWFHYVSLALVTIGSILLIGKMKHMSERKVNRVLIIFSLILLTFELYKQIIFTYQANGSYQWYAFPFQFCSTPMYVALLAGLTRHQALREALLGFLATFGLFAGIGVMVYPVSVFVTTTGINIQTMVHHGGMVIIGVSLLAHQVKLTWRTWLLSSFVFASLMVVALIMNFIHNTWIGTGTFNMFFINPLYENEIPVLSLFQPIVPHSVFLLIYLFGFMLCAAIPLVIRRFIARMTIEKKQILSQAK